MTSDKLSLLTPIFGLLAAALLSAPVASQDSPPVPPWHQDQDPSASHATAYEELKPPVEDEVCSLCDDCASNRSCLSDSPGWLGFEIDAFIAQGFTWNPGDPSNNFNTPITFNDRANEYQLNQIYVSLRKPIDKGNYWNIGGRADLLYGTDYFFVTSRGLETHNDGTPRWNSDDGSRGTGAALYGLALPQAYADVYAPIGNGITFTLGHFANILGFEQIPANRNFFYSKSYLTQYAQPYTHTGAIASAQLAPGWTVQAGTTRGWNTWEDPNGELAFLGSIQYRCLDDKSGVKFAIHSGSEDLSGNESRFAYSLLVERQIGPNATHIIQHNYGVETGAALDANLMSRDADWYGITNYLFFDINPGTALGVRAEWFRDAQNSRVLGIPIDSEADGQDYFELSVGLTTIYCNGFVWQREIRWDWSDVTPTGAGGMFNDFSDDKQLTIATSLVYSF